MKKIIGINPVKEALKTQDKIINIEIYDGLGKPKISDIIYFAEKKDIAITYTKKREKNTQGVVMYLEDYNYEKNFDEFYEELISKEKSTVLILDNVQDPRNFGAIIRNCETFGVDAIIIPEKNSVDINETVVKTSTGAIEYVDIIKVQNLVDAISKLKKIKFWVYAAEANGTKFYDEENYPDKTCLILGSEGFGIRKKIINHCDLTVKIPMYGKINSLNVSVAGGILLSEISKNRRG